MELRYNLTQQDFKRGILLHERRLKKPLDVIRNIEWFFFLAMALFSAVLLVMLTVILAAGRWEEGFGTVLGLSVVTLIGSLCFLWVLSARRRAFHGARLMAGEGDFFGPRTLTLTKDGVAVAYGVNRRVEPYDAIREVWSRKGCVLLYLKSEIWEVVPPCAFSGAEDYPEAAKAAILEMFRQRGPARLEDGLLKSGVVIRHLILPGQIDNSLGVLDFLSTFAPGEILLSLMCQYTPMPQTKKLGDLSRPITREEYDAVLSYLWLLNLQDGYTQDFQSVGQQYIPKWDLEGV